MDEGLSGAFLRRLSRPVPRSGRLLQLRVLLHSSALLRDTRARVARLSDVRASNLPVGRAARVVRDRTGSDVRRAAPVWADVATLSVGVLGLVSSLSIGAQICCPICLRWPIAVAFACCLARLTAASMLMATAFASSIDGKYPALARSIAVMACSPSFWSATGAAPWSVELPSASPSFRGPVAAHESVRASQWSEFRADIEFEQAHVGRGHLREDRPTRRRIQLRRIAGACVSVALAFGASRSAGAAALGLEDRKRRSLHGLRRALRSPRRRFLIAMAAYIAVAAEFLVVEVRMRRARYWMHILPAVVIVAAAGWVRLCRLLPDRVKRPALCFAALGVAALLFATASASSEIGNRMTEERVVWMDRRALFTVHPYRCRQLHVFAAAIPVREQAPGRRAAPSSTRNRLGISVATRRALRAGCARARSSARPSSSAAPATPRPCGDALSARVGVRLPGQTREPGLRGSVEEAGAGSLAQEITIINRVDC